MFQESGVFNCNRRLPHYRGDTVQWDFNSILVVNRGQDRAVSGKDNAALGQRRSIKFVGQGLEISHNVAGEHTQTAGEWNEHQADQRAGENGNTQDCPETGHNSAYASSFPWHIHQTTRVGQSFP